jgi:choline dehydrogenase
VAIPRHADTIVVGGGTSGAVVAGLLAQGTDQQVLVLEAGPDFGPAGSGLWPDDLKDARAIGISTEGGYTSEDSYPDRIVPFERARVIGGCSAHNGCAAIWGSRVDFDAWAAMGLNGWSTDDLLPLFHEANCRMRVRTYRSDEITPFHQACLDAAAAVGFPLTNDLNNLDENVGMAASPVNIHDGVRWNAAFAYLDPARTRPNLRILGNAPVSRIVLEAGRAVGVETVIDGKEHFIACERAVVSAGTYESPMILARSGIGDPGDLAAAGIAVAVSLPGVGKNLHDHPSVSLAHAGTPELVRQMEAFAATTWMPEEQTIAKLRSGLLGPDDPGFDLHIYPVGGPMPGAPGEWRWIFPVACMTPHSRGHVRLRDGDPLGLPVIDHRYLEDEAGHDRAVLRSGVEMAREMIASSPLRDLVGEEIGPGPTCTGDDGVGRWVTSTCAHYYHPVGTCAMGVASDPMAVTDARGRVHGVDNLYVADCSIMPVIPRANTNIPAVVVGERIGRWLLEA